MQTSRRELLSRGGAIAAAAATGAVVDVGASLAKADPNCSKAIAVLHWRCLTCHQQLSEPVQMGPAMDNAWMQAWSAASGTSAIFKLQSALQSTAETLDRKAPTH